MERVFSGLNSVLFSVALAMTLVASTIAADAGSTRKCGGGGGDKSLTLSCPSGQRIIGIGGGGGSFLEGFGILCGKPDSKGYYNVSGKWKFGPKGRLSASGRCPDGFVVNKIDMKSGLYVDRLLGGFCANCKFGECTGTYNTFSVNAGGNGGNRCVATCPDGQGLYKVVIRHGLWIDSIKGYCSKP